MNGKFNLQEHEFRIESPIQHVDMWYFDLPVVYQKYQEFDFILAETEIGRAFTMTNLSQRSDFVASRIVLRLILSEILNVSPMEIQFGFNVFGKPYLTEHVAFNFSLSRSNRGLLLAFSRSKQVGVDIEKISESYRLTKEKMDMIFSRSELKMYQEIDEEHQKHFFYKIWTRKEALLKAMGIGISIPLHTIDVSSEKILVLPFRSGSKKEEWLFTDCSEFMLRSDMYASLAVLKN